MTLSKRKLSGMLKRWEADHEELLSTSPGTVRDRLWMCMRDVKLYMAHRDSYPDFVTPPKPKKKPNRTPGSQTTWMRNKRHRKTKEALSLFQALYLAQHGIEPVLEPLPKGWYLLNGTRPAKTISQLMKLVETENVAPKL